MKQDLSGRVAIVTGATSGIGRATALALAAEGTKLLLVGRDEEALTEVVAETGSQGGGSAFSLAADVTQPESPALIVGTALERFGRLDILVNAAGIIDTGTVETTTDEAWQRMMAVNVTAPFALMRAAVPAMTDGDGAIVNVSSVTGARAFPGVLAYCVSKAAVDQLTRCAALELAPRGLRVNAVQPGVVVTNLHRRSGMDESRYAAFLERAKETHPLGRPGDAREIADLIVFLASPRAGWITGETIAIDGGRHLTCAR